MVSYCQPQIRLGKTGFPSLLQGPLFQYQVPTPVCNQPATGDTFPVALPEWGKPGGVVLGAVQVLGLREVKGWLREILGVHKVTPGPKLTHFFFFFA